MKALIAASALVMVGIAMPQKALSQEIDFERWEVGIDLLWLINKNVIPPSIFVKKLQLKQRENGFGYIRRGYRLRVGCSVHSPEDALPFDQNYFDIVIRPGYEWDKRVKSVDVFYGMDLVAQYQSYDWSIYDGQSNIPSKYSHLFLGISPVVGINYKVYKNLKLSIESNFDILFLRNKRTYDFPDQELQTVKHNGIHLIVNPLYVLNAIFAF